MAGKRQVRIIQQDNTHRRQQSAMEIVQAERMYGMMLDQFYKAFITPLIETPAAFGLKPSQAIMFSEPIQEVLAFSGRLSSNPQLGVDPVALLRQEFAEMTRVYDMFITKSIHQIFSVLNDIVDNKKFRTHIRTVQHEMKMMIADNLLLPIQRLSLYELMLRKYASSFDPNTEKEKYNEVIKLTQEIRAHTTDHFLKQVEAIEQAGRVMHYQLTLSAVGGQVIRLWNPERRLVQEIVVSKAKVHRPPHTI
eukprot:UN01281